MVSFTSAGKRKLTAEAGPKTEFAWIGNDSQQRKPFWNADQERG